MADWLDDVVAPRESGRRPNIGWRNTDLTPWLQAGKTVYGFPDWPGLPGPAGISTAGGLYGITKTNWKNLAPKLGVNDFSPQSQRKVADEIMRTQGRSAWAASEPGYKSGLKVPSGGPAEGYYDDSLHVTLRPDRLDPLTALGLDALLGGKPTGEVEPGEEHPLAMLDSLLGPGPTQGGEPTKALPSTDGLIEPPRPAPEAPNVLAETPLDPGTARPMQDLPKITSADPMAALDQLLAPRAAPAEQTIEPMGKGQELPAAPPSPAAAKPAAAPLETASHPLSMLDALLQGAVSYGGFARGAGKGLTLPGEELKAALPGMPGPEQAGAALGRIPGGLVDAARGAGEALRATMSGEPVAAQEMLSAGMFGMKPAVSRLPGGVPGEVPAIHSAVRGVLASEQGGYTFRRAQSGRAAGGPVGEPLSKSGSYDIVGPDGKTVAKARITFGRNGVATIGHVGATETTLGTAAMRQIARDFMAANPEVRSVRGDRISGGREGTAKAGEEIEASRESLARGGEPPKGPPPEPPSDRGGRMPMLDPPLPGEKTRQIAGRIDDALHRTLTSNTADKIAVKRWWDRLPRQYKDMKTRAMMADDIERRLIDREVDLNPISQAFLDGPGKRLVENENQIARELRWLLGEDAKYADLPTAAEGYVHRVVEAPPGAYREEVIGRLDPERGRTTDVVTGAMTSGRGKSLSKFAHSLQSRAPRFVLEDEYGNRIFQKRETLDAKGYEYGQKVESGGHTWTVEPPTMAEMEANAPIRYIHDYVGNLVSNVLRLNRIRRNVELLGDLKAELGPAKLFYPEGTKERVPENFMRVDLPQMKGHADPKIANVLNDFWNGAEGDLSKFLNNVNRFVIGSLFVTPVPHMANVGAHWIAGRGWDWLSIPGYIRGAQAGAKALNAVWNLTPEYTRMLREGSGLLYGDVAMENFYNHLMEQTWRAQLRNPEVWAQYAKDVLHKPYKLPMDAARAVRDLVRAEYRWSRKTLWAANDMLMLQRQFELEAKGIPTREAIRQAEIDIPNYRIPPEVMRSRTASQVMKSPLLFNFGRYHYGLMRALTSMTRDMISPTATARERWEGVGKLTVLGTIGILGYPALDALLQNVSGNEDATVRRFGPFGPIAGAAYLARNAYQKFTGESADLKNPLGQPLLPGDKEWTAIVGPLLTPSPVVSMIPMLTQNVDWMGRPVVDPRSSPMGMGVQAGEAAARMISPLNLGMQSMEEGGGRQALGGLVGLSLPRKTPGPSGKTEKMLRGRARSREKRDPVQNWIEDKVDKLRPSIGGP